MTAPAPVREPILEPDLPIIDPHHHLWDRLAVVPPPSTPVTHGFEHVIRKAPRYLLDELLADTRTGHNIRATVFVQCGAMYRKDGPAAMKPIGETEFVNGVAAMTASGIYGDIRACVGIVSHADMMLGDAAAGVLEAHIHAGNGRFRGIRHIGAHDVDPAVLGPLAHAPAGLYADSKFREGFARLAPLDMSFDAWVLEPQIGEVTALAQAFPETSIVLDHVGTPIGIASYQGRLSERFGIWRDSIRALAACPNVMVKLGGLAMVFPGFPSFMSATPATSEQLAAEWKPYIETCIEAFGADRCMFESNFPVDSASCTYDVLWNAFKRITASYSDTEKTALFSGAATRFYRLEL